MSDSRGEDMEETLQLARELAAKTSHVGEERVDADGITWNSSGMWHGPRPEWSHYDLWYSGTPTTKDCERYD